MSIKPLVFLTLLTGLLSFNSQSSDIEGSVIDVFKAQNSIVVDGKGNDKDWDRAVAYPLSHIYKVKKTTDKQTSTVKMLWDDTHLYFFFQAQDRYLTAKEKNRDGMPFYDDCFEVFLMPSPEPMGLHYGFEVNLNKTANDFIFLNDFYQDSFVSLKSYNPEYQVERVFEGTLNDNSDLDVGWSMELAIPIKAFHTVSKFKPLKQGSIWNLMVIRQDRNDISGNRTSVSSLLPLSKHIDVHEPNVFGQIKFVAE